MTGQVWSPTRCISATYCDTLGTWDKPSLIGELARVTQLAVELGERLDYRERRLKRLPTTTRIAVWVRDKGICRYCGKQGDFGMTEETERLPSVPKRVDFVKQGFTIDHVVPLAKDGGHGMHNLVLACRACNAKKKHRTPEEAGMPLLPIPE